MDLGLRGRVALVCAASQGLGKAAAAALAREGAHVVICSRDKKKIEAAARDIGTGDGRVVPVTADLMKPRDITRFVERAVKEFGRIDILVNNAGTNPHFGPILTAEESHWDKIFEVNVKGYFLMARAVVPAMRKQGGGKIINMASVLGINPGAMMGVYSTSKAAVIMLTKVLAAELGPDHIQVNAIAPGFIRTKFSAALWGNPSLRRMIERATPEGRIAEPDEVTGAVLYLASGASSFTTGSVLVVDGGYNLGSVVTGMGG